MITTKHEDVELVQATFLTCPIQQQVLVHRMNLHEFMLEEIMMVHPAEVRGNQRGSPTIEVIAKKI